MNDNGMSAAYRSLHINTSRRAMAYATYPMPEDLPDYPNHFQIAQYFDDYVDHFGFRDRIRFRTEVTHVEPKDGGWAVSWCNLDTGEDGIETYSSVIVANGHHWNPRWPEPAFEGQDSFEGEQIHVHSYKEPDMMRGKRVMVLGIGNSATDLAVEASRNADRTFLAMRRGAWIVPKYVGSKPTDELAPALLSRLPLAVQRFLLGRTVKKAAGVPTDYGLPEPDHKLAEAHPTVSSDLLPRLGHGDIEVKPNIARFAGGRTVEFVDGTSEEIDLIVYCTGYKITFPVLRPRAPRRARQPDPALSPGRPPRARRPLLRRPAAAARGDHAAGRGAVRVDRRPPGGEGAAALARADARGDPARGRADGQALRRLEAPHDPGRLPPLHARDRARAARRRPRPLRQDALARTARLVGRLGSGCAAATSQRTRAPSAAAMSTRGSGSPSRCPRRASGCRRPWTRTRPGAETTRASLIAVRDAAWESSERANPFDLAAELARIEVEGGPDGARTFAAPNRASWQSSLGGDGWAALAEWPGRLLLTPRAFALLAEKNGLEPEKPAFPPVGPNQRWLWQSILNGITLHNNFLTEVRAGRLRMANSRGPGQYVADMLASCLATPFVLLVSVPLEAIASLAGRGGRMVVRARAASGERVGDLDDQRGELAGAVEVR